MCKHKWGVALVIIVTTLLLLLIPRSKGESGQGIEEYIGHNS